jgi:hypothetical protein
MTSDVFSFKEHKLREGETDRIRLEVWREAKYIISPAIDGRHAARNHRVLGGEGGVGLAIHPRIQKYLKGEGCLPSSRGAWAQLEHPKLGRVAFLAVYAPNTTRERTLLWKEMYRKLSTQFKWVIMGDLNMYEAEADHKGGECNTLAGQELLAWQHLKRRLHLEDTFRPRLGHLSFSWDNVKRGRHIPQNQDGPARERCLRRLDRVYAHESNDTSAYTITSTTLPGFNLADHAPVFAEVKVQNTPRRQVQYRMNISYLPEVKLQV